MESKMIIYFSDSKMYEIGGIIEISFKINFCVERHINF